MEELTPEEQPNQNIEENHSKFLPFRIHKKLAILIFAGLFFLAFGVGAYYVGRQSVSNTQIPYPSIIPTLVEMSPFPTNNPPLTPATYQKGPNITSAAGCPSVTQNTDDCRKPGCRCLKSIPLEGCPQGFIIICSQTNSNPCSTDSDCIDVRGCMNCGNLKCVNKKCAIVYE